MPMPKDSWSDDGGGKQDGEMGGKTGKSGTPVVVKKKDGGIEGGGMKNGGVRGGEGGGMKMARA